MTQPTPEVNEAICWQCGAPAVLECAFEQKLNAWTKKHADGQGYAVRHGRRQDTVRVTVPRCEACQNRSHVAGGIMAAAFVVGLIVGGWVFSANWWMAGGFIGLWGAAAALFYYQKGRGRRSVASYPPLKRLLEAGWFYPD